MNDIQHIDSSVSPSDNNTENWSFLELTSTPQDQLLPIEHANFKKETTFLDISPLMVFSQVTSLFLYDERNERQPNLEFPVVLFQSVSKRLLVSIRF